MNSGGQPINRRRKPKVILVPRQKVTYQTVKPTREAAYEALQIRPTDRTETDIDAIVAIVGSWPDFRKFVHTEQERREVCRTITLINYDENQIIFKEDDPPDGWYLIFSGEVLIVKKVLKDPGIPIPPQILANLQSAFDGNEFFLPLCTKGPTTEFGNVALTKLQPRNATIVATMKSQLLIVDPQVYRDTSAYYAYSQLQKKASLLSQIEEFSEYHDKQEFLTRLAENMVEFRLDEIGEVIDASNSFGDGFLVMEQGLLAKKRLIDFSLHSNDPVPEGSFQIQLPTGLRNVRVQTIGPKTMFSDPCLIEYIDCPFSLTVVEPAVLYLLKLSDMASTLPTFQVNKIKDKLTTELSEEEVVKIWYEKHQKIAWNKFKKK